MALSRHPLYWVLLAGALLLLLACVALAILDWREREARWQRELDTLSSLHQSAIAGNDQDVKTLTETAVRLLAANPDVIDALRIASSIVAAESTGSENPFTTALRQQIRLELESYWQVLQASGVNLLYLYVSPGNTAFLRVHRPDSFGDDVSVTRPMVAATFATGIAQSGLEEGVAGLNYRSAVAVRADDNPDSPIVAVLEVGHPALSTEQTGGLDSVLFATVRQFTVSNDNTIQQWPAPVRDWIERQSTDISTFTNHQLVAEGDGAWLLTTVPAYDYRGAATSTPYATYLALQDISVSYANHRAGLLAVLGRWVSIYLAISFLLGWVLWVTYRLAIAQQQAHEKELTEVQRLARLGHWELDLRSGNIVWSEVMYELYGQDKNQFKPSLGAYAAMVHPDDLETLQRKGKEAQSGGRFDNEHRIVLPDGSVRWVHELAYVQRNSNNEPGRMIGTTQDISERKRLDQLQRDFVSTVSHELRTPLTSISGALSLLVSGSLKAHPAEQDSMLKIAYQNSQRLLHLINDLLDIDKLIAGKLVFRTAVLPLNDLLKTSVDNIHQYAEQHGVEIRFRPMVSDIAVIVDQLRFEQILANLLSNAAKFSGAGTVVEVFTELADSTVIVAVRDQGPGIPKSAEEQVFSRFYQIDSSDSRPQGGTGLGLAISRELAEKMGGKLYFDSTLEVGTTFYLSLPVHRTAKVL